MKIINSFFIIILSGMSVILPSPAFSYTIGAKASDSELSRKYDPRNYAIQSALDKASGHNLRKNRAPLPLKKQAYTTVSEPKRSQVVDLIKDIDAVKIAEDTRMIPSKAKREEYFNKDNPANEFVIGVESFGYSYREEGFMKVDGSMHGVFGEYSHRYRPPHDVRKWEDFPPTFLKPTVFRADIRTSGMWDGKYRSEGTGELEDERHYAFETRAMAGYDYKATQTMIVTPYTGFGYRYLLDDNGGRRSTTGNWGYDRESKYYYLPVGMDFKDRFNDRWTWRLNMEYDWFLNGVQKSHFEDDPNGNYTQTLVNQQPSGYGARSSIRLTRKGEALDIFFEPFVRYWHINDSILGCTDETCGTEPNNRTQEYGARMGVKF